MEDIPYQFHDMRRLKQLDLRQFGTNYAKSLLKSKQIRLATNFLLPNLKKIEPVMYNKGLILEEPNELIRHVP